MNIEVRVPTLPESVADGTLVNWHKKPGDPVQRDENLIDLETDKVVLEIPAPVDGVMGKILKPDGTTVTSGEVIATIESAESAGATAASVSAEPGQAAETTDAVQEKTGSALALSPAVRRLVAEHNLDAGKIPGSGRDHRITKADVLAFLDTQAEETPVPSPSEAPPSTVPTQSTPTPQAKPQPAVTPAAAAPDSRGRVEQRVSMTRLRARIAERLIQAQQTAAILTTFNEANMQPVMDLRNKYKDRFEKEHGVRLGFMSFFVKACVEALKRYPAVNGSIDGTDIIYHGYYDIGIAVSSPRGLVVPILRDADQMGFSDIEKTIREFGQRAQDGSLTMEDLTGGTFSITNGGIFGSLLSTPILNPPQSGILGMHKIMDRPMAEGGQVVVRPMMYLAHSYDHRIVDGREAVGFLVTVKECLEDPARLLLQI